MDITQKMIITRGGPRKKRKVQANCMADGCSNLMWARNFCNKHYLELFFSQQPRNRYERGRRWMRRNVIAAEVAEVSGITLLEAHAVINATLHSITKALKSGESVSISGFGTFSPVPPRPFRYKYTFSPAKELRDMINENQNAD